MKKIYMTLATALFFISTYSQSDICSTATALTETSQFGSTSGTTTGTADDGGNGTVDVFYSYTSSSNQTVNIGLCFTSAPRDTKLVVYSDCTLSTIIAENDDGGGSGFTACALQGLVSFQAISGSTYYIMVEGADFPAAPADAVGDFEISLWTEASVAPPAGPNGITCTPSVSGPSVIFTDEMDDNSQGWTGAVATSPPSSGPTSSFNNGMWEIIAPGGATSTDTGPNAAFSGTSYMNFEASGTSDGETALIVSPDIDLTGTILEDAELTFYMHGYGSQMGTLNVGISTTGFDGSFTNEFSWTGQLQSVETESWVQVGIDLSGYLGDVINIQFSQASTGDWHGDMAIDLVEVNACDTVLEIADEEEIFDTVTLYPNPANDIITIRSQEIINEFSIYNLLGQEVRFGTPNAKQTMVDIANLEVGVYIVKVKRGEQYGTYKIVKQ